MRKSMREIIDTVQGQPLYEADEYGWVERQITALREGRLQDLDGVNLIDYLTEMNRSTQKGIRSALSVLVQHMLKIQIQPHHHSQSWNNSIRNRQEEISDDVRNNPSLVQKMDELYAAAYARAKRDASSDTGIPERMFPAANPWPTWHEAVAYEPPEPPVPPMRPKRSRRAKP